MRNEDKIKLLFDEFEKKQSKKRKNNNIFIILLCLIISGISSVASYSLGANSVSYTAKDTTWEVENTKDAIDELRDNIGASLVGSVYSYMGTSAPFGYLACDGTVYNISDYPRLADHINKNFGKYNYFGGDGSTTFAVPDLRGEFLRGSGTNSHSQTIAGVKVTEGNGASVGTHQGATVLRNIWHYDNGSTAQAIWYSNSSTGINSNLNMANTDRSMVNSTHSRSIVNSQSMVSNTTNYIGFSTRPTNTSVLYIIKY